MTPPVGLGAGACRLLLPIVPAALLVPVASTVVVIALPAIMAELALGSEAIWWLVTGYLVLVALLQAPTGRLGDRLGHRRVLMLGTLLMGGGGAVAAWAPDALTLVAGRLLQGVAGAAIVPPGLAIIRVRGQDADQDRSVGIFMGAMIGGALLGVVGGGLIVSAGGWRDAFGALAVLAGGAALIAFLGLPPSPPATSPGKSRAPDSRVGPPWRAAVGIALASLSMYVVIVVLPLRFDAGGWSASGVGIVLGAFVLSGAVGALTAAPVSARVGRGRLVGAGGGLTACGSAALAVLPSSLGSSLIAVVAGGAGVGAVMSALFAAGMDHGDEGRAGSTSGLLCTARYVGSIAGTASLPPIIATFGTDAALLLAAVAGLLLATVVGSVPISSRRGPGAGP